VGKWLFAADCERATGNSETISIVFVVCRSHTLDSKLSIRTVAGFAELAERKENHGRWGPIRADYRQFLSKPFRSQLIHIRFA
jgi:hypothetical protein